MHRLCQTESKIQMEFPLPLCSTMLVLCITNSENLSGRHVFQWIFPSTGLDIQILKPNNILSNMLNFSWMAFNITWLKKYYHVFQHSVRNIYTHICTIKHIIQTIKQNIIHIYACQINVSSEYFFWNITIITIKIALSITQMECIIELYKEWNQIKLKCKLQKQNYFKDGGPFRQRVKAD